MVSFIDSLYPNIPIDNVDLVERAGRLCKPPISGQRLIQELQKQRAINAFMAYEHHRLRPVVRDNESQYVRYAPN